ncbi:formimidoylglutamate deiminase [Martelella sp. HB161492]|uniref:formimidoylglutamate deiminase n=1 Tax=Martelella sp. HB161492 TaxID=2720726 RepID=UPI0015927EA0|nr:formimidoylglutamate deiminase [Martelella sp. HB161492]
MTRIFAETILTRNGLVSNARLTVREGLIDAIATDVAAEPGDERHGLIIPAIPNLHSHAFQRAMAGMTERRGMTADSFWSWRELMYRFAWKIRPDEVEAIAAQLYMEMLEAGFGRVGEFHYLHNGEDGGHYDNIAEMAERIAAAATKTGIGLTLLPVFYAQSGFGGLAPHEGQRRFIHDTESFARLMAAARQALSPLPTSRLGVAPHSLRAVTLEDLGRVAALAGDGPIHIHVAEQLKEVEDCIAWSGTRPVSLLFDNAAVDGRWCLIHATHMSAEETARFARSGAVAGLCPVTEANLGDGTFPAAAFLAAGGRLGVGSDSNVLIGLADELRQLEYSARLAEHARNVIAPAGGSTGRHLIDLAVDGGARALGASAAITEGGAADFVSLDTATAPWLQGDAALDGFIFANAVKVDSVWIAGRKLVENGRHRDRDAITARFHKAMATLMAA